MTLEREAFLENTNYATDPSQMYGQVSWDYISNSYWNWWCIGVSRGFELERDTIKKEKYMKNFILGFVFGSIIFGVGVALAAPGVLFNTQNAPIGTTANPLYIEII